MDKSFGDNLGFFGSLAFLVKNIRWMICHRVNHQFQYTYK